MDRSLAKLILFVGTVVMLVLALVFSVNQMPVGTVVLAAVWIVFYCVLVRFLRCPNCGRIPGRDGLFAQYCPNCGEPLED